MTGFKLLLLLAGAVCQTAAAPQILTAALAASGLGGFTGIASLATDTETLGKALDLGGNVTRYATYMVKNASDAGSTVARVGLNQTTALGSKALTGGVGVGKQAIDLAESAGKHFPGGQIMSFIAPAATVGLDLAGKIGNVGLNVTAKGGDKVLDVGNQIVQYKAELVNTGAQKFIGVGRVAVDKMDSVKDAVSGLTSAFSSGLTSATSGLTSAISSGLATSGSSFGSLTSLFSG